MRALTIAWADGGPVLGLRELPEPALADGDEAVRLTHYYRRRSICRNLA